MIIEFNWEGYDYQSGLKTLRRSYERAHAALQEDVDQAHHEVSIYRGKFPDDDDPNIELDEDGVIVHDPMDSLIYAVTTSVDATHALRKAFAIMVFHHWERGARSWTGRAHGKFETLMDAVKGKGYPIDDKLPELHILVNALKHNSAKWGVMLFETRPEWFPLGFQHEGREVEWFATISVDAHAMNQVFDVVARSGPDGDTIV